MGYDDRHYVPILKAKAGELRALREVHQTVRNAITPLLEIMDVPPRWLDGEDEPVPSKSMEQHIAATADALVKNWGTERPLFVDGLYVEGADTLDDGREPFRALLDHLRDANMKSIPVTGMDRYAEYDEAIKGAVGSDGRGLCLRLEEEDFDSDDLEAELNGALDYFGIGRSKVDLVVDYAATILPRSTLVAVVNSIPQLKKWRSFTLSACSFPKDMRDISANSIEELAREEWLNWTHLRARRDKVERMPTYSDYAINHPQLLEIDPREMRMSGNIRYTWTTQYVVARGEAFPRKKDKTKRDPPRVQYPRLAKEITEHKAWMGPKFSWGDAYIQECANGKCVGGGREWRAVGTSHHLASVVQQIANLP